MSKLIILILLLCASVTEAQVVPVNRGGTGKTTAADAIANLLPPQTGQNGKVLGTNGSILSWVTGGGGGGGGTVTSIVAGSGLTGGTITTSGTIAIDLANANIWSALQTFPHTTAEGNEFIAAVNSGNTTINAARIATLNQSTTGSAGTLSPGRTINGVAFDGSTNITVTAAAGTLSGATLASNVLASSLTSVGTLANLTVTNPITGSVTGTAADLSATLSIAHGGTGQTTANTAFNALAPAQSSQSGKFLTTDGTNTSWGTVPAGVSGANPTATIGTTAVNGSASTFMRSDAAPAFGNLTGVVTSTGMATAIANGAITNAMLANGAVANLSGANTGDQTITLTGDVTGSGTGSFATALATVTVAKGGTGATTLASNGILYGNGTSPILALAVNSTAANKFLTQSSSNAPAWNTIVAGDVPTLNQNTTGSAATWTTARNLAGNSVDGSANVAFSNKFIVQGTADAGLSGAQFLGSLGTGIVKNTTTTGVLSIAVAGDFPTLNQSTTGSAATLTTPRAIYGNNFDGSAALSQIIASTYGGTGNGFTKFSGPATSEKTFTLPNATATILTDNAAVTVAQGGTSLGTLTAHAAIMGNGTSAPNFVAPGANGNVLTSNGTDWVSSAAGSGAVSSVSNADGTLTISPTTGAVVASLALANANVWTALITESQSVGTALTPGITLSNPTAATVGAQKYSPALDFVANGWKTTATAGSKATHWTLQNQTVQGTTSPASNFVASYQVNGGTANAMVTIGSDGSLTLQDSTGVDPITITGRYNAASGYHVAVIRPLEASKASILDLIPNGVAGGATLNSSVIDIVDSDIVGDATKHWRALSLAINPTATVPSAFINSKSDGTAALLPLQLIAPVIGLCNVASGGTPLGAEGMMKIATYQAVTPTTAPFGGYSVFSTATGANGWGTSNYGIYLGYVSAVGKYTERICVPNTQMITLGTHVSGTTPTAQSNFTDYIFMDGTAGHLGIGVSAPTALLHLAAGTTAANSAPLKFTSTGNFLTTPELGAMEFDGTSLYVTLTGPTRSALLSRQITMGGANQVITTTTGNVTTSDANLTYTGGLLTEGQPGIATTYTNGIIATNSTAATSGVPVQQSPSLILRSHVWNTTATATDSTHDFRITNVPTSSASTPGNLLIDFGNTGRGYANIFGLSSAGALTLGTALTVANGGSGDASHTAYAILAGGTTTTGAVQSISGLGTSGQALVSNGAGALPTWQTLTALTNPMTTTGDIIYSSDGTGTPARLAIGASTTVLHGGTTPAYSQIVNGDITNATINLTTKVTGVLPEANGGTNQSTYTTGDLLYASASNTLSKLPASTSGYVLQTNGASTAPTWSAPQVGGQWIYGSGNDGTVYFDGTTTPVASATLSGSTYTLTRDIYGGNITVAASVTVVTSGYQIYGTGTFLDSGIVHNNGNSASGTTAGANTPNGDRTGVGSGGATGRTTNGNGSAGNSPTAAAVGGNGTGGAGGAAGSGGFTGGAGGVLAANFGFGQIYGGLFAAGFPNGGTSTGTLSLSAGCGGGSGGLNISTGSPTSGAGGSGAGNIRIACHIINVVSGASIKSNGGTGSAAALAGGTGDGGGGGGGGGGIIWLISDSYTNSGTVQANGGTGGAAIGLGSAGSTGSNGAVVQIPNASATGYLGTSVNLATQVTGLTPLANGGTNANLTASNGGIFYSTATAGAMLAGTSTASQLLMSGATAAPTWSTATYPSTYATGDLPYASATNVVSKLPIGGTGTVLTVVNGLPSYTGPTTYQASPSNPTGTTSATGLMMGLAGSITCVGSGTVLITVTGDLNSGATGAPSVQLRHGTGSAPTNGAALTGTAVGSPVVESGLASASVPFTCTAIVSGLTLAAHWIDVSLKSDATSSATVTNLSISAYELK